MLKEYRIGFGVGERANGTAINDPERERLIEGIERRAAEVFGGFNLTRGSGGWINPEGRLVREPSATLSIITSDPHAIVEQFAGFVRDYMEQHSVILFYPGGEIRFIEA